MADEVDAQVPDANAETDAEFDWEKFFLGDDDDPPVTETAPAAPQQQAAAPTASEEEDPDEPEVVGELKRQIADLQKTVTETAKTTMTMAQQQKMTVAIDAWKSQASPSELEMADVLVEAQNVDELKRLSGMIKRVTGGMEKAVAKQTEVIERKVQKDFGLPVTPTFQPIPDKAEYDKALEEGDLDKATALALKGVFNS